MKSILFILVAVGLFVAAAYPSLPPLKREGVIPREIEKPAWEIVPSLVPYDFARERRSLDESWGFQDTLIDANPNNPELFNAYPVAGALTQRGRGYIATLHTVFATQDYGRTWTNLDQNPPPGGSNFTVLRTPHYISTLAPRTVHRDSSRFDTFYVVTNRSDYDSASVRLFRFLTNNWYMYDFVSYRDNLWFSHLAIPDSNTAALLSGSAGRIVRTDTLIRNAAWHDLDYNFFGGYLAGRMDMVDSTLHAVGSHHWVSRDQGRSWEVLNSADPLGDYGVDFCDDFDGWVGGGRVSPNLSGWARHTTDRGGSWSPRLLTTPYPIRSVACINDSIVFAAGGHYESAVGGIWKTTNTGQSWTEVVSTNAEIRVLEHARVSPAYVDLVAAGVFPDLRGGVWTTRLFLIDTTGYTPIFYFSPDTLRFPLTQVGQQDSMGTWIHNSGEVAGILRAFNTRGGPFIVSQQHFGEIIQPGDSLQIQVVFRPDAPGDFAYSCDQENATGQMLEVHCFGSSPLAANDPTPTLPSVRDLLISPNPGNAEFRMEFVLEQTQPVTLTIFDLQGRVVTELVRDAATTAGRHTFSWNAGSFGSGIYFARLATSDFAVSKKILLLK